MATSEPFPLLSTSADQLHNAADRVSASAVRRRRQSSGLGSELRVGDTGAPGLATSIANMGQNKDATKRAPRRRKAYFRRFKQFATKHTCVLPLVLLFIFLVLYAINPTESNPISRFIFLSYELPPDAPGKPPQYGKGRWDIAFVTFYTVVLSFTREFIMQELLRPLSRYAGVKSRGKQACFKFYYLFQAAYWAQQAIVLVLGMEKPRKDFKELIAHHIVSLALIALSYRFHFTYIGLAVYVTHDISDFFLATAKLMNYIDHALTGPYFAFFMGVWIYLRHFINLRIIWSLLTEFQTVGPFELNWETQQYKCRLSQVITLGLLSSLQALNLFWLFFIVRIAYRFVFNDNLRDDRSDVETEAEDSTEPAATTATANGASVANGSAIKKRK
ncbi:hypothetical protein MCOR02_009672 [Pyricularia oryzae]|nr:hypothetical protein MCOR01_001502 [Pyricularia oryzae]KAH9429949.1 hypothetical protein MCOR02_009672 [Pyricularia oryzae]KAI6264343.1 hypothetical protein MCOR26_011414 [Pyricularia oryzae]KAI6295425.1 hypothetical protein MCOR34_009614 [Pyricularia oryzae]KAI6305872.1 hypothetical protein MCOR29_010327 [Pyricularia oryzae]